MPIYEIEMGQGISTACNTFQVCTTTLYTCTFIGAAGAERSGAFHYPSSALGKYAKRTIKAMNDWIGDIEPTQICLVFAEGSGMNMGMGGDGTSLLDQANLKSWAKQMCKNGLVRTDKATSGIVSVNQGRVDAGSSANFDGLGGRKIDLKRHQAGVHIFMNGQPEFSLWGRNEEMNPN